jgi:menaquinone-dependent protoporphyrinogen IX oxidase
MKFVIVYSSRYGNGKKCVNVVEKQLRTKGHEVEIINAKEASPDNLPPADMYIFSGASEAFNLNLSMKGYLKKLPKMEGQKFCLISTHRMDRAIGLNKMDKLLSKKKKMEKVSTIDFKVEGEVEKGDGLPQGYEGQLKEWVNGII